MYHVIVNPIAGGGRSLQKLPVLRELFEEKNLAYAVHETTGIGDAIEKAKKLCATPRGEISGIIGIGGDGTFQEIVTGMLGYFGGRIEIPLGIIPAGSGNDFTNTLQGKKNARRDARFFFELIVRGQTRTVDVLTANDRAYLNIGNIGLDAQIVKNAAELKEKYPRRAYYAAVYKSIMRQKNIPLKLQIGDEIIEKSFTLVAICNGRFYGGGMKIAPSAEPDDGKITLCMVDGIRRAQTMVLFPTLMMVRHGRLKYVNFRDCDSVKITLPPGEETLCLDGNLYPVSGEIEFKVHPGVLDVFV